MRTAAAVALCVVVMMSATGAQRGAAPAGSTPRWPDGRVRLGAPAGVKGFWRVPDAAVLVEPKSVPFMPWSSAVFQYRQQTKLKDDPVKRCLPPGGPRQFQGAQGFQFVEQREIGRILVLLGGGNRNWRVIHTDGRPLGASAEAVPSYYGSSVGRWEGDTLVVDSVGYNERFWMTGSGLPPTKALHLIERFTRANLDTLRYEATVDDPRTYTRQWTLGWTARWVPDQEIPEYFCEEDRP